MIKYNGKKYLDEGYNSISIRNKGAAGVINITKQKPVNYETITTTKMTSELNNTVNDIALIIDSFIHSSLITSVKQVKEVNKSYDLIKLINGKSLKLNCDETIIDSLKAIRIKSMYDILLLLKSYVSKYEDYSIWLKITEFDNLVDLDHQNKEIIVNCSNKCPILLEQILKILIIDNNLNAHNTGSILDINTYDERLILLVNRQNQEFLNSILNKVNSQKEKEEEMKLSLQKRQLKMEE